MAQNIQSMNDRSNLINLYHSQISSRNDNTQQSSNNFLNDQITSLSSSSLVNSSNENKANQVNRTSSAPVAIMTGINQYQNKLKKTESSTMKSNDSEFRCSNNALTLGDYYLYEPHSINDTFGLAKNHKTDQSYYWKKFDRRDYMKKMETYFIMEGSERIFSFKEIIFDSNDFLKKEQYVYVIFNLFYGDLHSYMKEKKRLDETEAKFIFRQCVEAVNDCHQRGVIVRDIKLKKFVFIDPEKTKIALTNPEDCLVLDEDAENDMIKSQQGCPAYVSPEVLNTSQVKYSGKLSDSWSLGIVLYTLLLGRYPFHHQVITTMFARISRAKFQIPPSTGLSLDAKILLRSLIRLNASERILPSEILESNWLKQLDREGNQLQQNKFKGLNSAYQYLNQLNVTTNISIGNNQFYHKPLGISRSSPGAYRTQNQNTISKTTISMNKVDVNDRIVPEFTPWEEPKKSTHSVDYSIGNVSA